MFKRFDRLVGDDIWGDMLFCLKGAEGFADDLVFERDELIL